MSETADETKVPEGEAVTDGEAFDPVAFLNKHTETMFPEFAKHNYRFFMFLVGPPKGADGNMDFVHIGNIPDEHVPPLLRWQATRMEEQSRPRDLSEQQIRDAVLNVSADAQDNPAAS
jgi:hypothetical protein